MLEPAMILLLFLMKVLEHLSLEMLPVVKVLLVLVVVRKLEEENISVMKVVECRLEEAENELEAVENTSEVVESGLVEEVEESR